MKHYIQLYAYKIVGMTNLNNEMIKCSRSNCNNLVHYKSAVGNEIGLCDKCQEEYDGLVDTDIEDFINNIHLMNIRYDYE